MSIRPSFAALNARGRYAYKAPSDSINHLVVGGGVVGLAIARKLLQVAPDKSTFLVERHSQPGQETRYVIILLVISCPYSVLTASFSSVPGTLRSFMLV